MGPVVLDVYAKRRLKRGMPRLGKFIASRYRNRFEKEPLADAASLENQDAEKGQLRTKTRAPRRAVGEALGERPPAQHLGLQPAQRDGRFSA